MAKFKIEVERKLCTSCGNCVEVCSKLWEMAEDGFSHLKGSEKVGENEKKEVEDEECAVDAAESCPVAIIHVYRDDEEIA